MKVLIKVTRKTEYASIVEMDEATYKRLEASLHAPTREQRESAEEYLNGRIDTNDWQDDELYSVDEFKEFKEEVA